MSVVRTSARRTLARNLGLMASASVATLLLAGQAQAACVAANAQPIANVTTSTQVNCTGANSGQTIIANTNAVQVRVVGFGNRLDSSTVQFNGDSSLLEISGDGSSDLVVSATGNSNTVLIDNAIVTNIGVSLTGTANLVELRSGAIVTADPAALQLSGSGGEFILSGQLYAIGNGPGGSLLTGGGGSQTFTFEAGSTFSVQANGQALNAGSGDDIIIIKDGAFITGGTANNIVFNGGANNDQLLINGSGISNYGSINIEQITIDAGPGGLRILNGVNADAELFRLLSGATLVRDDSALGLSGSVIDISAGATLQLAPLSSGSFNHSLAGSGTMNLAGAAGTTTTFGGDSTGFTGLFSINSGNTALVINENAFGEGQIGNAGVLSFGGLTLDNVISGTGSVVKAGPGVGILTGVNSYAGGTSITGGVLQITNASALGSGAVVVTGGSHLDLNLPGDGVLSNDVSGAGGLRKFGAGTVDVVGTNSYTGGTQISAGALRVDDISRLGTGPITADFGASLILNHNGASPLQYSATILGGSGSLVKEGSGILLLSGVGNHTGGTVIRQGTLGILNGNELGTGLVQIDAAGTLGLVGGALFNQISGDGRIVLTGGGVATLSGDNSGFSGQLDIQQGYLVIEDGRAAGSGDVQIAAGTALLIINTSADSIIAADLSGAGDFYKSDSNRVILTGNNSYTGFTAINAGVLQVAGSQNLGTSTVVLGGPTAALNVHTDVSSTLSNEIQGTGRVVKTGLGTVSVTGPNSYSGGTDIQAGAVRVTDTSFLGTGSITVSQGAFLDLSVAGQQSLNQALSGAGSLRKSDAGELLLLSNSLTGGIDVVGGRVIVNTSQALGSGPVSLAAGTGLVFDTSGTEVLSSPISGSGGLTKAGSGVLVISNANNFTGGTVIEAGRLGLNNGAGLGTGGVTIQQGAQLSIGGVVVANTISGAGSVLKTSNNTGFLTGVNTYSGGTDIQGGALGVTNVSALGSGGITVAPGAALLVENTSAQTLSNALSGGGGLQKSGTGDLTISNNALTGGLAITGGRVFANGNTGLGSGAISVSSGAELVYTNASNATLANGLSGGGLFRKLGAGQLLFNNPFSIGTLSVDAGSVRLNTTMTGNAVVGASGRLDGTGRVIGNLTNNGVVAPGNSIGTLTVQGNYTQAAGSVLEIEFDGNGAIDLLSVTGSANLNGGTLRFISTDGGEGSGGVFLAAAGGVTGTFSNVETVGAQLPLAVVYEPTQGVMAPSVLTARPSTFNAQSIAAADTMLGFVDSLGVGDQRYGAGKRVWATAFGAGGERSASGTTLSYEHDIRGLSTGINVEIDPRWTIGASFGWSEGDIALGSRGGSGDQVALLGSVQTAYALDSLRLGGGVFVGRVDQKTVRNVTFSGFAATIDGDTTSWMTGGFAEVWAPLGAVANWQFSANARMTYVQQTQDGYTEDGASPLRLTLGEVKTRSFEGLARVSGQTRLWSDGPGEDARGLDLRGALGVRYVSPVGDRELPVTFAASNAGVVLQADERETLAGQFGLALAYTSRGGARFSLDYLAEAGRSDRQAVQASISLPF